MSPDRQMILSYNAFPSVAGVQARSVNAKGYGRLTDLAVAASRVTKLININKNCCEADGWRHAEMLEEINDDLMILRRAA